MILSYLLCACSHFTCPATVEGLNPAQPPRKRPFMHWPPETKGEDARYPMGTASTAATPGNGGAKSRSHDVAGKHFEDLRNRISRCWRVASQYIHLLNEIEQTSEMDIFFMKTEVTLFNYF